jgi:hypothetical protein
MNIPYQEILRLEEKLQTVIEMAESQAFRYAKSPDDLDDDSKKTIFATHQLRKNLAAVFDAARIESL